jgi:hypothetical protein
MSEDAVEDSSVPEGNDAAYVVSVVAVTAQNFKSNQFRHPDGSCIAVLPYLIAVGVVLCGTCGTSVIDFRAGRITDALPSVVIIE